LVVNPTKLAELIGLPLAKLSTILALEQVPQPSICLIFLFLLNLQKQAHHCGLVLEIQINI